MRRPIPYTDVIIDPTNAAEVQHWAKDLQVETCELRASIRLVGPRVSDLGFEFATWLRRTHGSLEIILTATLSKTVEKARKLCNDNPVIKKPVDHRPVQITSSN